MIVDRYSEALERVTGDEPRACPWAAMRDPFVVAVMGAARAATGEDTTPALLLEADPPHAVWLGVQHYVAIRDRVRALVRDEHRKEAERKRAARG